MDALWEDVKNVAERTMRNEDSKVRPHFMGAIVLQPRKSKTGEVAKTLVVDGQQRLTTLQLLIKASQWAFQAANDNVRADRLRALTENKESHLGNDRDNQTKIRQSNHLDQKAFYEAIIASDVDGRSDFMLITRAYRFLKEKVETWLNDGHGDRVRKSDALEDALAKYLEIAVIDLDSDEKPHIIFETLNARGEPLKQSDLVKNTVMYEANVIDDSAAARRLWSMFDDLWWRKSTGEPRVERIQLDRFLNHWMVMQSRQEVSHQRVAAEFREHVGSQQTPNIETIAEGVRATGVIYKNFLEVRDDDEEIRNFLKRMKILDIAVAMPLLLWLETSSSHRDHVKECFQIIESYLVRRMLCGLISHGLGGFFANLLNKLHLQSPTDYVSITSDHFGSSTSSSTLWPNDRMLIERLSTRPLAGTVPRRKMVLEAIEDQMRGEFTEQLISIDKLTVEHLMPRKWGTHWRLPSDSPTQEEIERRDEAVKFLGNLTLTTSKLNSSLSNAPWREKHGALEKHGTLLLTKSLLSNHPHHFDEDSIFHRTSDMAERVAMIWRPLEHFKKTGWSQ